MNTGRRHLTQKGYKGVLGEGVLGRGYMFLLGQKEHILANIGRKTLLGAKKKKPKKIPFAHPRRGLVSDAAEHIKRRGKHRIEQPDPQHPCTSTLPITTSLFFGGVIFDPKAYTSSPDSSTKSISTKMLGKIQQVRGLLGRAYSILGSSSPLLSS